MRRGTRSISRLGYGALFLYAAAVIGAAFVLYAFTSLVNYNPHLVPITLLSGWQDFRYGRMHYNEVEINRCRTYSFNNYTSAISDSGVVPCEDANRIATERDRYETPFQSIQRAFRGH
jgi:hypothetical protein